MPAIRLQKPTIHNLALCTALAGAIISWVGGVAVALNCDDSS